LPQRRQNAGNCIIVTNRRRMAAINFGSIVVAVAIGGGFGDINARVLA
jgi:hypothetical protein